MSCHVIAQKTNQTVESLKKNYFLQCGTTVAADSGQGNVSRIYILNNQTADLTYYKQEILHFDVQINKHRQHFERKHMLNTHKMSSLNQKNTLSNINFGREFVIVPT